MTEHPVALDELMLIALDPSVSSSIIGSEQHIASCSECQATINRVRAVQSTVQIDHSATPSSAALLRVQNLIRARSPRGDEQPGLIRRLFASLTYDSRQPYAAAGLRGSSDSYMLSYTQENATLDLEIEPATSPVDAAWHVTGQLELEGLTGPADIAIVGGRGEYDVTMSDEFGLFSLAVQPGLYDLLVSLDDATLVFSDIEVGVRDSR